MDVSPVVLDVETVGLANAADYLEPVVPDGRFTDPVKIALDIDKKERERLEKLSLDWNVGRVAILGFWTMEHGYVVTECRTELQELAAIANFWDVAKHRTIVGFNAVLFDLRFLIQRSRFLAVDYPQLSLSKYGHRGIVDLYLELTFNDGYTDQGCMRRSLKAFCRRFDIPCEDKVEGKDIPKLIAAGDWAAAAAHCEADLMATVQLAQRLKWVHDEVPV